MCLNVVSPRDAALRMLAARYETADASHATFELADFQKEAVARALDILKWRNGVIIADSVGLGKTFIAAALIEQHADCDVVLAVPAATRSMWLRTVRRLHHDRLHFLTHGQLSRGQIVDHAGLVVVDEAHAFRNPNTRRYRALRRVCRSARVVLLTATPVNNSLSDLMFQIRLWCADDAFRDLGIGSLNGLLTGAEPDTEALARLRRAIMIRRTRAELRRRFASIQLPDGRALRFPGETRLETIPHVLPLEVRDLAAMLETIEFAAHAHDRVTPMLLQLSLLKRLQSSKHAALISVARLIRFGERFLAALSAGRWLQSRLGTGEQLMFDELMLEEIPAAVDVAALERRVQHDLLGLRALDARLAAAGDDKLARLTALLDARRGCPTLVFSEFRDTAELLWRRLGRRYPAALITGSAAYLGAARCARAEVIRRFAPRANGAPLPRPHEAVEVLFATDVVSEGLNLQDADAVVSYDLPWNPVRLVQRAGRIDRLGSEHSLVRVYNFLPDREFDQFLKLVRTLRNKLADARRAVGQERAVLEPLELDDGFLGRLAGNDASILDEPAGADGLRAAWEAARDQAAPTGSVAALPGSAAAIVTFVRQGTIRELIVTAQEVREDRRSADALLDRCLAHAEIRPARLESVIERGRAYLRSRDQAEGSAGDVRRLAQEITRAIRRLGLLCPSGLLDEADRVLRLLPGYLGQTRADLARLRSAHPENLPAILSAIGLSCTRPSGQPAEEWQLIAAIAAD